jgi:ATP-dependent Clp protease adaptor protein ClpS
VPFELRIVVRFAIGTPLIDRQILDRCGRSRKALYSTWEASMAEKVLTKPRTKTTTKTERPKLWKVILLNDDYTPREFVVQVLKAVFRMNETQAYRVMITAHQKGACVIAVFTKDIADTKAKEATDLGKQNGFPLYFSTEPEE